MEYSIDFQKFMILRTPLLPFAATEDLREETLREIFRNPLITEALFIASPDLVQTVQLWLGQGALTKKDSDKLLLTLRKYLLRMASRCTPYGLFAGISRMQWGAATTVQLVTKAHYVRHSRVDMDYLSTLAVTLGQNPEVRERLLYYPNNTLYTVGEQYRYVEYSFREKVRHHGLVTVDSSEYLKSVLKGAQRGQSVAALTELIVDSEISLEEAREFVMELIDSQVLVSELEPAITGKDYLQQLIQVLRNRLGLHPALAHLEWLDKQLAVLDKTFDGKSFTKYAEIIDKVRAEGTAFEANHLLQVDMLKPTVGHALNESVQGEISSVIRLLHKIENNWANDELRKFRSVFLEQYEQQEIPLLQALDMEMGIGYPVDHRESTDPAPLLNELPLGASRPAEGSQRWTAWQEFLFEKYLDVINGQATHVTLTDEEVKPYLTETAKPLPASLYCIGTLLASSPHDLDNGNFQLMYETTAGPSAANLLGRFCHLDEALTADVREALSQEEKQNPDAVFAEIVHLNQSRIGNISTRLVLRDYEIPILVRAGVDEAHTLPLDDLRLSVQGENLVLRSARLNRQVIPRLSSAHNFALHALPVYHFLCTLQFQQLSPSLSWHWGLLQRARFLPRVSYGKTILSRAKWRLSKDEVAQLTQAKETELFDTARRVCQGRGLPLWIVVAEGDNKMPIKLDSLPHLQILQAVLRRKDTAVVEEYLLHSNNLIIEGPEGAFTNEFIFPISIVPVRAALPTLASVLTKAFPTHNRLPARTFSLGSEWLYVKLYCGLQTADRLLVEIILPLVRQLKKQQAIDTWFFIRYKDPDHHLRLRFHGTGTFYGQVIAELHEALRPYEQANLLAGLRTDTYQRELERYGTRNIALSEALFHRDSDAVLRVLALLGGGEGDQVRWLLAMRSVDALLTDFGRSTEQKLQLMDRLQHGFKLELESTSATAKKAFGAKYRQARNQIEQVLNPLLPDEHELAPAVAIFAERSRLWAPVITTILQQEAMGTLEVSLDNLLASHVHMVLNRFFRSKQRLHEAVVYDFMCQYYTSSIARASKGR